MSYHDIDPRDIDPDTGRPYSNYSSPSLDTSFHDGEMDIDEVPQSKLQGAMDMGALACELGLTRDLNPFTASQQLRDAWDEGFSKACSQWRARLRADIADQYGDEAADYV